MSDTLKKKLLPLESLTDEQVFIDDRPRTVFFSQEAWSALGEGQKNLEKRFGKPSDMNTFRAGEFSQEVNKPVQMLILDRPECKITVFLVDGKSCREIYDFEKPIEGTSDPRLRALLADNDGEWRAWQDFRIKNFFVGTPPKHVWSSGKDDLSSSTGPRSVIIVDGEKPRKVEVQSPVCRAFLNN